MSAYCTVRDVRLALAPVSQWDDIDTAASLPDEQIADAISEAQGMVDSFLSLRYSVPEVEATEPAPSTENPNATVAIQVAPNPIRRWTRSIAAYLAALTFRKNKDLPEDDPVRLRYNMALGFLTAVRDRQMDLTDEFEVIDDNTQGVAVVNQYEGKLFHSEDVGLFPVDFARPQVYWPYRRSL